MQNLNQFQDRFEQHLAEHWRQDSPAGLYDPVNYILSLGGKRLRPLVLLMAHSLFSDELDEALPAARAIELFHNFTLLHDDIMDNAPLRRGKPTVHEKYSLNTGILSGDVMLVLAYESLFSISHPKILEIASLFTRTAREVCEGQQMDMNFERRNDVSIPAYIRMIELKTSVLVACALEMGALLGGADSQDATNLYEFGRNLGIAFQIQDDLLDTFGDPEKFGKKPGGDIVQNKKTYLYLKALEIAETGQREELQAIYNANLADSEEKIRRVVSIFNHLRIKDLAEKEKNHYQALALQALAEVSVADRKKKLLEQFADALMRREV